MERRKLGGHSTSKRVPTGKTKENVRKEISEKTIAKNLPDRNPHRNMSF